MLVNIKMFDFTQVLGTKIVGITKEEERKGTTCFQLGFHSAEFNYCILI